MLTLASILLAAAILVVLAIGVACVLGWANQAFHVEVDPLVARISKALPGANCGGCGFVGCAEYAEAVAAGLATVTLCGPGGESAARSVAEIVGVDGGEVLSRVAVVHCGASAEQRLLRCRYDGESSCAAANLVTAVQGCVHGCLGLGDCARACSYGALTIVDGLAVVDADRCLGCGKCVTACPRGVISLVPFVMGRTMFVACSNPAFGPDVKRVCSTGCVGCKACTKVCEAIEMKGNLPVIYYDRLPSDGKQLAAIAAKCHADSLVVIEIADRTDEDNFAIQKGPASVRQKPVRASA